MTRRSLRRLTELKSGLRAALDPDYSLSGLKEKQSERGDRREEIKLFLEYIKLVLSALTIGTVIFAALQWRSSNFAAAESVYERLASDWRENLRVFLDKPELRPYFEEGKKLEVDDPNRNIVLAFADLRLDVMDAVLTYPLIKGISTDGMAGWRNTFWNAFSSSPALCQRLRDTGEDYGLVVDIGKIPCHIDIDASPRLGRGFHRGGGILEYDRVPDLKSRK